MLPLLGFDGSGKAVAGSELAQSNQVRGSIVRESSVNLSNIESSIETEPKLGPVGINRPEFVRNPFKRPWEGKPPQTQEELNAYFPEGKHMDTSSLLNTDHDRVD